MISIIIGIAIIAIVAWALLFGYRLGKDDGFIAGLDAAAEIIKETTNETAETVKRVQQTTNPDCGWK